MRKFQIITCFILFAATAFSQVPGFQGKKFSVYFTLDGFPALQGLNYRSDLATLDNSQDMSVWHLNLNTRKIFDADYVVSRQGAVGATLQFLRTGTTTALNESYTDPLYGTIAEGMGNYINVTSTAAGIYYKFFFFKSKGSIAPLGAYSQLEVLDFINSAQSRTYQPLTGETTNVVNYGNVGSCLGLTLSEGQQSIFFNRLIINISIQFGVIPSYLPRIGNDSGYDSGNSNNVVASNGSGANSAIIEDAIRSRLAGMIFMNANIGVGLIIF